MSSIYLYSFYYSYVPAVTLMLSGFTGHSYAAAKAVIRLAVGL